MLSLLQALEDLVEASESMAATYECIRGRTPEDDDTHTHELWAEKFLAERANAAKEAIASARMAIAAPEMLALLERWIADPDAYPADDNLMNDTDTLIIKLTQK